MRTPISANDPRVSPLVAGIGRPNRPTHGLDFAATCRVDGGTVAACRCGWHSTPARDARESFDAWTLHRLEAK